MSAGKITRTQDREGGRHTAAILRLQRAEVKMVRAMRAWDKAREVVRRYDVKADKRFGAIPGKLDIRDLPGARAILDSALDVPGLRPQAM